ncbi:MAG: nitrile hydratase accessory protein [Chloroflexi bacterium]|nr:nitrile hydratase accessory protein [Chloroflexota bacterium]
MTGDQAPPRMNGERVFNEPWEGRAFGLAAALTESGVSNWADFRDRLVEVTAACGEHGGETAYYERWFQALERLVLDRGLVTSAEVDSRTEALASDQHDAH